MTSIFTGLSAFPLTPLLEGVPDERSFVQIIKRLVHANVDSITVLGSTGSYAYLNTEERARITQLAVEQAEHIPVFAGVGALRTSDVLTHVQAAETAGASGLLLAPMTYQPLTDDDVFELFRTVTESTDLPVVVHDNPGTTHFTFDTALYARVAELPGVASIKIPGVPSDPKSAQQRVEKIRCVIPENVTIGISGDAHAATGLNAGCDVWYSAIAGTLPDPALKIARAALEGRVADAVAESEHLAPLWDLFSTYGGSLRVTAAIAEQLGLAPSHCLPLPIQGLDADQRAHVAEVLKRLGLR